MTLRFRESSCALPGKQVVVCSTVVWPSVEGATVVGASDVGLSLVGASDVGLLLVGASDVGLLLVGASDVGRSLVGASDVGLSLVCTRVVGSTELDASVERLIVEGLSVDCFWQKSPAESASIYVCSDGNKDNVKFIRNCRILQQLKNGLEK